MRKLWSATLILMFIATIDAAQTEKKDAAATQKDAAAAQKAAMEAMMRAGTAGEAHKKLNGTGVTSAARARYWQAPGSPATEAAGKSVNEWILGGRWVQ